MADIIGGIFAVVLIVVLLVVAVGSCTDEREWNREQIAWWENFCAENPYQCAKIERERLLEKLEAEKRAAAEQAFIDFWAAQGQLMKEYE